MAFWLISGAMSLVATVILISPFLMRSKEQRPRTDYDAQAYQQQPRRLKRDIAQGLFSSGDMRTARADVQRRLLRLPKTSNGDHEKGIEPAFSIMALAITIFLIPAVSFGSYMYLGGPGLPDAPLESRKEEIKQAEQSQKVIEMVERLAARMKDSPGDAKGWEMLGRSYQVLGNFEESSKAFAKAYEMNSEDTKLALQFAEAIIFRNQGYVSPDARKVLEGILASDPGNHGARFYFGLALAETAAELPRAIEVWEKLLADTPEGSPWLTSLREQLRRAKASAKNG